MGIWGNTGPQTPRGTKRKMVTGDGRMDFHIQTGNDIYDLSGGIFGEKRKKRR